MCYCLKLLRMFPLEGRINISLCGSLNIHHSVLHCRNSNIMFVDFTWIVFMQIHIANYKWSMNVLELMINNWLSIISWKGCFYQHTHTYTHTHAHMHPHTQLRCDYLLLFDIMNYPQVWVERIILVLWFTLNAIWPFIIVRLFNIIILPTTIYKLKVLRGKQRWKHFSLCRQWDLILREISHSLTNTMLVRQMQVPLKQYRKCELGVGRSKKMQYLQLSWTLQ